MLGDAAIDGSKAIGEWNEFCDVTSRHWQRICTDKSVELHVGRENGAGAVENDNRLWNSVQDGRECRRLRVFSFEGQLALLQQCIACSLRASEFGDVSAHCETCQTLYRTTFQGVGEVGQRSRSRACKHDSQQETQDSNDKEQRQGPGEG